MPIYAYRCEKCNHEFDVFVKGFNHDDTTTECENCGKKTCKRLISAPAIEIAPDGPDRYERMERDHAARVKDPERARSMRKRKFGTEGVSITKSPLYHKEKKIKAQGKSDVDKREFIKMAALNPNALNAAKKVLGKS